MAAKEALRKLIREATTAANSQNRQLSSLIGVALFDPVKDGWLTGLGAFEYAKQELNHLTLLSQRFGADTGARVLLQLCYSYFESRGSVCYDESTIDSLWDRFKKELRRPVWISRAVGNLRSFQADQAEIRLPDGIAIQGRDPEALAKLGFGEHAVRRLLEDWTVLGTSSFVLICETRHPKSPETLLNIDSTGLWAKAYRTVGALRLLGSGSVRLGPIFVTRAALFNVGLAGVASVGTPVPSTGAPLTWSNTIAQGFPAVYSRLEKLEVDGYGQAPGNLAIALRSFMASYDRWPALGEDEFVDLITALESLLGTESEISFRLAFRVAGILGKTDADVARIFHAMRDFYDARSKLVHGGQLKPKHLAALQKLEELKGLVRALLVAMIRIGAEPIPQYPRTFFQGTQLDVALMGLKKRGKLRKHLGLR